MNSVFEYLSDLSLKNNREWYHANKVRYQQANAEFEHFIGELIMAIGKFDSSVIHNVPKDLTFKMVRDIRFSHDKSPYNPKFRAHISSAGKLPIPVGYYIVIAPGGQSFLGGGLFAAMFKDATTMIRDYITKRGSEFEAIISAKTFTGNFSVKGETLKKVPQGYNADHPQAEYLKNKSWYLVYSIADELVMDTSGFIDYAAQLFQYMKPFNDYLNTALKNFIMPAR